MPDTPRPTPAALQLSDFLPFRLSVLSNTVSRRIAAHSDREFGLSVWQWRVMAVVGESPGLTASEVTDRTIMDKVAVSRAVNGLIDEGHLEREAAQDDGRRSRLFLTSKGAATYARIAPLALALEAELTASLSPQELDTLKSLLNRLAATASPGKALW